MDIFWNEDNEDMEMFGNEVMGITWNEVMGITWNEVIGITGNEVMDKLFCMFVVSLKLFI